jgi:hypothetical protein
VNEGEPSSIGWFSNAEEVWMVWAAVKESVVNDFVHMTSKITRPEK